MTRQLDLDALLRCDGEQFLDLVPFGWQGRRSLGERHADLEEHPLQLVAGNRAFRGRKSSGTKAGPSGHH